MTTQSSKFRGKRAIAGIAALFVLSSALSLVGISSASAATKKPVIKNGVACTKKLAKAKAGSDTYICTQNPMVKAKKLTWVWQACLTADKNYIDTKANVASIQSSITAQLQQNTEQINKTSAALNKYINAVIEWSAARDYAAGDIVYIPDGTYYIAKVANAGKNPTASGASMTWGVNQPTTADPKVGTIPTVEYVYGVIDARIIKYQDSLTELNDVNTTLTTTIADLQQKYNDLKLVAGATPSTQTTNLLTTIQSNITSLTKKKTSNTTSTAAVQNSIKTMQTTKTNMKTLQSLLDTLTTNTSNLNVQKSTVASSNADISQSLMIRNQSCASGL